MGRTHKDVTLMDIAVMGMRKLREEGKLQDLDVSEEINACSIVVKANIDGKQEDWLVMFKTKLTIILLKLNHLVVRQLVLAVLSVTHFLVVLMYIKLCV